MKKNSLRILLVTLLLTALFVLSNHGVSALTIEVDEWGNINFYQGAVLGKSNNGQPMTLEELKAEAAKNNVNVPEDVLIRKLNKLQQKQVEIEPQKETKKVKVRVMDINDKDRQVRKTFENIEEMEVEKVRLQVPNRKAQPDQNKPKTEQTGDNQAGKMRELKEIEQVKELEIDESEGALKLKDKGVTARTSSPRYTVNSEGEVILTTPSGTSRPLNHFPEEAVRVMFEKTNTVDMPGNSNPGRSPYDTLPAEMKEEQSTRQLGNKSLTDLQIVENGKGELVYLANVPTRKRILGIFPWEFSEEYVLNDSTGDVQVKLAENESFLNKLLNAVAFE